VSVLCAFFFVRQFPVKQIMVVLNRAIFECKFLRLMFAGILQIIAASAKKPDHTLDLRNHLVRPNLKAIKHLLPTLH
jgi:hypothetical protein